MSPVNLQAYAAQLAIIVVACAGLPRLLRVRSPIVQYTFWRALLAVCLLLPIVQPWQPGQMMFVPAPGPAVPPPAAALPPGPPVVFAPSSGVNWFTVVQLLIVSGVVGRFAWIAAGMIRLRRMRRRATDAAVGFEDLQKAIGAEAPIHWSSEVRHPVTFGVWKPVVLLPIALKGAEMAAQRAVVAHELHHVKRRDWSWVVAEEMIRSVFWFHPAMWWLVSRVQLARETVVDELSILATNARRTYLDTLLAFAAEDDTGFSSSPAFSARRHLFHRVMLLSKEGEMSSSRVALGSCVLILALGAGSWGAVTAFPLYETAQAAPPRDAQKPPRDPISADAYHRMAVEVWDKARRETTLPVAEQRQLIRSGIAAEDRALALRPDFFEALAYKNILLRMLAIVTDDPNEMSSLLKQADELRSRALTLQANAVQDLMPPPSRRGVPGGVAGGVPGGVPSGVIGGIVAGRESEMAPPRPSPSPGYQALTDQLKPVRIGGGLKMPMKIKDVKPVYPPIAQSARVQGVVIVEVLVDANGSVVDGQILRSIPLLDAAALDAVKQWKFVPSLLNGNPTAVVMTVTVNFALE